MSEHVTDRSTVDALRADFQVRLAAAGTDAAVKALARRIPEPQVRQRHRRCMKTLGTLAPEARREFGALVNALKTEIESGARRERAHGARRRRGRPPAPSTSRCPAASVPVGRVHPLMRVRQQVEDIFTRMGYEILEGPEVEDDFHNFEALNMPPDHPARDMQDTLYLGAPIVGGTWGAHTRAACRRRRSARRRCCARTPRRCRSAT